MVKPVWDSIETMAIWNFKLSNLAKVYQPRNYHLNKVSSKTRIWFLRLRLTKSKSQHRDRDWQNPSLNIETETETDKIQVSTSRPRLWILESQWQDRDQDFECSRPRDKNETQTKNIGLKVETGTETETEGTSFVKIYGLIKGIKWKSTYSPWIMHDLIRRNQHSNDKQ